MRHITIDRNFCRLFAFVGDDSRPHLMPIYIDDDGTAWATNGHLMRKVPLPPQGSKVPPTALLFDKRVKLLDVDETVVLDVDETPTKHAEYGTFAAPGRPGIKGKLANLDARPDYSYAVPTVDEEFVLRRRYFIEVLRSFGDHFAVRAGLHLSWSDRHQRRIIDPFSGVLFSTPDARDFAVVMPARLDDVAHLHGRRRRVVVESPYAGSMPEEIQANETYARACMVDCLSRNEDPIASHLLYPQVLDDTVSSERETGMNAGFNWRAVADMTVVYDDRGITPGMQKGIEHSEAIGVPVVRRTLKMETDDAR